MTADKPIGVFDSGYGGLTILKQLAAVMPAYDYLYLGDNARAPYGTRSFETVYQYTAECVKWFFDKQCPLVILACNTASAKALRTIQQRDLVKMNGERRVLGVIRPTAEIIGNFTKSNCIGILATNGTVQSNSYIIEINKFFPGIKVFQQACPMWVPLVENNEHNSRGADYFIKKDVNKLLEQSKDIDTILLACTHYPLLKSKIQQFIPSTIKVISQGEIVANSLARYMFNHPSMDQRCSKNGTANFYTTDSAADFDSHSKNFFGRQIHSNHVDLNAN